MTFFEELQSAVRGAASSNPYAEAAPVCILWTDAERLFEPLLSQLQAGMPELYVLGDYAPEEKRGPAIWLRYMLDGQRIEGEATPIFYLPGVARAQLRAEDDCPFLLAPLCELVFRGKAWAHENGRDWTPTALLISLGIEVQTDTATKQALQGALLRLAKLEVDELRTQSPLSATVLNDLMNPDPVEALLNWMCDAKAWKAAHTPDEWTAFRETCITKYGFHPEKDGELRAAELLGARQNAWESVWRTFQRSPHHFKGVIELLGRARPQQNDLFVEKSSWPHLNAEAETALQQALSALADVPADEARKRISELEAEHGERRKWVWCELGLSPMALSLAPLSQLATLSAQPLTGATPQAMAQQWTESAWQCDTALLDALACVEETSAWNAAKVAARALYRDWLSEGALQFGQCVAATSLQTGSGVSAPLSGGSAAGNGLAWSDADASVCYLFADGLRFDVAQKLMIELEKSGLHCDCQWQFGPLPGVTPTAKPAAMPLPLTTLAASAGLEPRFSDGRKVSADALRSELKKNGFQILMGADTGEPQAGPAWTECGMFDKIGHDFGAGLAKRLGEEIRNLASRVRSLLAAGWSEIRLTTDHGWLLLPGNLEKAHLHEHLTEVRKGRCARLKPGSPTDFQTVPWHWDASVTIAVAPGARCFEEGREYEHGGLSVQECVLPRLTVRSGASPSASLRIESAVWKGFRCVVAVASQTSSMPDGYSLDLRTKAVDTGSSLCDGGKTVTRESVTLMISDECRGIAAHVVLLDAAGDVVDKVTTEVPDE